MIFCSMFAVSLPYINGDGSVPQVVLNPKAIAETEAGTGRAGNSAPPVRPLAAAAGHGEHEIVGVLPGDGVREPGGTNGGIETVRS
jgi:hypothetical protein